MIQYRYEFEAKSSIYLCLFTLPKVSNTITISKGIVRFCVIRYFNKKNESNRHKSVIFKIHFGRLGTNTALHLRVHRQGVSRATSIKHVPINGVSIKLFYCILLKFWNFKCEEVIESLVMINTPVIPLMWETNFVILYVGQ